MKYPNFPLVPRPYLSNIELIGKQKIENYFETALNKLLDPKWQIQFKNGYHLRMFINKANIYNEESRFLSNVIIWEWLYPHLKNSSGATPKDESYDLEKIFTFILCHYWSAKKRQIEQHKASIFYFLRNQLAHSGKLPIDREKAEEWMKQIGFNDFTNYLAFFDRLTQVIVLKTLGIDAEVIVPQLHIFLERGQLSF